VATLDNLATRGGQLTSADPTALALRSALGDEFARRGFDIGMAVAVGDTADGPGKQAIRDALPLRQQGGFSAGVYYSLQKNLGLQTERNAGLAGKGEAIANLDPLSMALRAQQPSDAARRGFDIGMAAAENQTAQGPGKDAIRDSLPPAERPGFVNAVDFSVQRNSHAVLASTGAKINDADPVVAAARNADQDVFFRLGFDIASGLFGDPALGSVGNTALGPGSYAIRDSLSASGQRGFMASKTLHFSRKYVP